MEKLAVRLDEGINSDEFVQILSPNGELVQNKDLRIDKSLLIQMYKNMVRIRSFDRKSINLQRQGRMGTYAPFEGQEASQVGSAMALETQDWLFPTYRDHGAMITHGQPMENIFLYWMGHVEGSKCPPDKRILPQSVPIATQTIHAVGTAWASKLKGESVASIAYFGDGATSEGDFHEAMNFANVFKVPAIFFCQNNGYAISTSFYKQSASRTIFQRAAAYDMTGVRVDGNDVLAVWSVVTEARQRALQGLGPTLIEAVTFRYGAHTTADDPKKYRDQEGLAKQWRMNRDPINRLSLYLRKQSMWDEQAEKEWQREVDEEIANALQHAVNFPKAKPNEMFNHVYAEKPWNIREQEDELLSVLCKVRS